MTRVEKVVDVALAMYLASTDRAASLSSSVADANRMVSEAERICVAGGLTGDLWRSQSATVSTMDLEGLSTAIRKVTREAGIT